MNRENVQATNIEATEAIEATEPTNCLLCTNEPENGFHGSSDSGVYSYYLCSDCTSDLKRGRLDQGSVDAIESIRSQALQSGETTA